MPPIARSVRPRPERPRARGRSAALVVATVLLGAVGHLAAGGTLAPAPPPATVVVLLAAVLLAAVLALGVGGRRAGTGWTAAVLASGQVAVHLVLGGHVAHDGGAHDMTGMTGMTGTGGATTGGPLGAGASMLLAHVLVVVALAVAAGGADRAVAAVRHGAAARSRAVLLPLLDLPGLLGRPTPPPVAVRTPLPDPPTPTVGVLFARVLPRRGPPLRRA